MKKTVVNRAKIETEMKLGIGEEIEVALHTNDNFFLFRDAWLRRGDRKQIIGEAAHGGHVIYRYEKES